MTRRILATIVALLLPLANAAQWAGCGTPLPGAATVAMAMNEMPMGDESAPCAPVNDTEQGRHHGSPCGDSPGSRDDCQASMPCGVVFATVTLSSVPSDMPSKSDGDMWRDQITIGAGSLRPEPPPPRS